MRRSMLDNYIVSIYTCWARKTLYKLRWEMSQQNADEKPSKPSNFIPAKFVLKITRIRGLCKMIIVLGDKNFVALLLC